MSYPQQAHSKPTACGGSYMANLPDVLPLGDVSCGTSEGQQHAPRGMLLKVGNRTKFREAAHGTA